MSHDELPPNTPPLHPTEETAVESAREASSAEPSPVTRPRRRAKVTQTETASEPAATVPAKPVRSARGRRKTSEPDMTAAAPEPAESHAPGIETPPPPAAEPEPPAAKKPSRRGGRGRKTPDAPEATATPAPDAVDALAPEQAATAETPARPSGRRRASRKTESRTETSAESASLTEATAPVVETPPSAEPEPPAPTQRPSRRRGGRGRKPAATQDEAPTQTPAIAEAATPSTEAQETEAEAKPSRRSRSTRSRRRAAKEKASAETSAATDALAAEPVEAKDSQPAETEEGEGETPGRSRRRGRSPRRGKGTAAVAEEPAEPEVASVRTIQPEPEEQIDLNVGAHLIWRDGIPEIRIHGATYPPILFFGNMEGTHNRQRIVSQARRAAQAGVHLHSTLIELPCPLSEASDALDEIDNRLRALLDADPEGFVMPRIVFVPARGWKREYPSEISTYADGTTGDPSITSDRFWQEAEYSLATLIAHLKQSEWGQRIFGYHLERGEWFQPADLGYDRSPANRDAFRDWLRDKYHNNLVTLRAAWYDGDVQFHTAEIPPVVAKPIPNCAFYETRRGRRTIDFNEFTSESTARRLVSLARAIKKETRNQALVSVCYGYTFEFGHPFSGHLALGLLQSAQSINLICGPPSYRDRKVGGAASFPAPVDSLRLHGKLWLSEDDTKTYLAPAQQDPEDFNPRLGDRFATEQAHSRAMGRALATRTGIGWMDLWGEGWLDDDGLWERLGALTARYQGVQQSSDRGSAADVIVLIDEKSLLHVQRGETFFRKLTQGARDTLQRAGVAYETYLQSDVTAQNFPTNAKLYLFLTPYRLTTEQRAAIQEKLQRGNKTLVWLYAPGTCEEYPGLGWAMEEAAHGTIGFALHQQAWNSEIGSRVIEPYHAITERLPSREIGTRERLNPAFYVSDSDATVLAEYQESGLASLAVKTFGAWKSVFLGDPVLPLELLRGLCRFAGVPVWLPQGEDVAFIGNGWVTIHAAKDGQRTLHLPERTGLYDMTERRLVADEAREYRFFLRGGMTRVFCVGPVERFLRLGLPNVSLPGEGRARITLDALPSSRREPPLAEPLSPSKRADLETLEAVLTVDISALEALEIDGLEPEEGEAEGNLSDEELSGATDATSGEVIATGRRRRRRGRNRWRRPKGAEGEETPPNGDAAPPEPEKDSPQD